MANKETSSPRTQLLELVLAANKGDKEALGKLRQELNGPKATILIEDCGNLAYQAEESIFRAFAKDQPAFRACVLTKADTIRASLGWREAPPLERLLIDAVTVTWMRYYTSEIQANAGGSKLMEVSRFQQQRVDRALRRHLSAIKTLATVRKMALPLRVDIKLETESTGIPAPPMRAIAVGQYCRTD